MSLQESQPKLGVVVIGRNEGERLRRCLTSLSTVPVCIYVDSASSDDSVPTARALGADVVVLSSPPKLTAARGRNAGLLRLLATDPDIAFVQMMDGDCEIQPGWLQAGIDALAADPGLGLVFGRRRERHPERSVYNALCDDEWNVPIGEALTCGGDVLCRVDALEAIGGYDETMIAGEDPDMSVRLRANGWRIARINADMTLHDAAILSFGQWWRRAKRAGHAFAELAYRHRNLRAPNWRRRCGSIVLWGGAAPGLVAMIAMSALVVDARLFSFAAAMLLLWPLQVARLSRQRRHLPRRLAFLRAGLLMTGKIPEFLGLVQFHFTRLAGRQSHIMEYKGVSAL